MSNAARARRRQQDREWRAANGYQPRAPRNLTLEPLLAILGERPDIAPLEGQLRAAAENRALGVDRAQRYRWRQIGISVYDADRLAVRLGTHPALIWDDWFADCETVDA